MTLRYENDAVIGIRLIRIFHCVARKFAISRIHLEEGWGEEQLAVEMRPMPMDFFAEMDDQPSTVAMDVDDVDPLEIFGEGVISIDNKLTDADFFNNFEDDFDDSDIN